MKNKWSKMDIFIVILEILAPVISLVITCILSEDGALSEDDKLAIICGGISIPIILLQFSVTNGQNFINRELGEVKKKIEELSTKMDHFSPIFEQVFITNNERIHRFVYRRMNEVTKTVKNALNNNHSGYLRTSEYYEELLYLADLIEKEKAVMKRNFSGEIWAMTSFAEDEWIADAGYEKNWTERLKEISDLGIKTRRLCIIPDSVYNIISAEQFNEPSKNDEKSFWGFIGLLEEYYNNSEKKKTSTEHYFIRESDSPELSEIKGFFAIQLSNGELHILYGETANEKGSITAKVLFDPSEIQRVRSLFERFTTDSRKMKNIISISHSNGFEDFLTQNNITFQ